MTPQDQFCPNPDCPARGKIGEGNIGVHSQQEKRYICHKCGKTFSERVGTALYGLKKSVEQFVLVVTLLSHGCPIRAIVAAFGLDERTVRAWMEKAGLHCQEVHEHFMEETQLDLGQIQADEIKVKAQGGSLWMALAEQVSNRLWLGGEVSPKRDRKLIRRLADQVRDWALCRPIVIAVDGLSAYVTAFRQAFRTPVKDKPGPGRPRLWEWADLNIVQVVKKRTPDSFSIIRRIAHGQTEQVERVLHTSQPGDQINTSYIERLKAAQCHLPPAPGSPGTSQPRPGSCPSNPGVGHVPGGLCV